MRPLETARATAVAIRFAVAHGALEGSVARRALCEQHNRRVARWADELCGDDMPWATDEEPPDLTALPNLRRPDRRGRRYLLGGDPDWYEMHYLGGLPL